MPKTNETIVPSPLKRGDHVAIIATARKVSIDILSKAEQILQSWGLVCLRSPNLLREHHQFSGSDDQRSKKVKDQPVHGSAETGDQGRKSRQAAGGSKGCKANRQGGDATGKQASKQARRSCKGQAA